MTNTTKVSKVNIESEKLFFESLKHLTTINTGTIVILAAFLEKDIPNIFLKILIAGSLVLFLFSLIACTHGMFSIGSRIETRTNYHGIQTTIALAFALFIVGVVSLVAFFGIKIFF